MTNNLKALCAEREKLYQNLFTSMNEGLAICEIILDKNDTPYDYRFLEVNAAFEKIKGISVEQVQGKTRREFGETAPHWLALFGQVVKTEKPASHIGFSPEYGKWFDLRAFPLSGEKFAFLLMDITERQQEKNFGEALNDINEIIYSKLRFDEVMNKIIIAAVKNIGCETAAISLGRTSDWTIARCYGFPEEMIVGRMNQVYARDEGRNLITELIITAKQTIIIHDAFSDPRINREQAKKWNIHSIMAIPLIIEDQVIGVIFLNYHQQIFKFSPSYINFAHKLAATISLAIKNAQLFDRIRLELTERNKMEEALCKSEENYRELVESSNSIILRVDKNLKITFINEFAQRFLGFTAAEIIGKPVVGTIIPPANGAGQNLAAMAEDIIRNPENYVNNIHQNTRKNGELVWISWTNKALYDAQGNLSEILSIGNDITDLKQLERTLEISEESEERLKALMNHNPSLVFLKDEEGRYVYLNDTYEKQFIGSKDWYGKTDFDFWPKESAELFRRNDADVLNSGQIQQFLEDSTDLEGTRYCWLCYKFPFTDSKNRKYLGGIGINATERIIAEEALKVSEQKFKSMFESSPIDMALLSLDGTFIDLNQAALDLHGFSSKDELIGKNCFSLIDKDYHQEVARRWTEAIEKGSVENVELEQLKKDGQKIHTQVSATSLKDTEGKTYALLAMVQDITERKKMEQALRESEERLTAELAAMISLQKLSISFVQEGDLGLLLDKTMEVAVELAGADKGTLQLIRSGVETLDIVAQRGFGPYYIDFFSAVSHGTAAVCAAAFQRGERVIVEDVEESPIFVGTPAIEMQRKAGVRAVQSTPVVNRRGAMIGILSTHWGKPGRPGDNVLRYMDLLANQAADIIERKKAEEALRESEERLRAFVIASSDVIYRMSPDWGEMRYLQGKNFIPDTTSPSGTWMEKYIHPDDRSHVQDVINEAIRTKSIFELEHRVLQVDSSLGWTFSRAVPLMDARGAIVEWFGTASDITKRKRAEKILRDSEQQLRLATQAAGMYTWELDIVTGEIKFSGDIKGIIGFSYTEYDDVFSRIGRYTVPEDGARHRDALQRTMRGEGDLYSVNRVVNPETGEIIWMETHATLLRTDDGAPLRVVGIARNISEHKKAEEALRESEEQLRMALTGSQAGMWIWDLQNYWKTTPQLNTLFGRSTSDPPLEYHQFAAMVHPEDRERLKKAWLATVHSNVPYEQEYRILWSDGSIHWLRSTGAVIELHSGSKQFLGISFDITERKRMEEVALASERELLQVTLNSLGEGVLATDQDEKIILINEAATKLTGYSTAEAIGQPLYQILYLQDDKTSKPITQIPNHALFSQFILFARDGRKMAISFSSAPIKTTDDKIIGTVIVFQDITEKQRTDRELLRTEKLESIGILAGGIAHDFNNLLGAILSNIQLAQMKYKKNANIDKYLLESVDSTRRASELTRQLLTFAKGGAPVKKAASLAEIVLDTATFALRGSNVKVDFQIAEALWPVEADTGQISQVIHNLVINAKQAMPKGGILQIGAENVIIEPDYRFKPGNYLKITVKDQGVGIPKENLSKIFDPFFTTKKEGSGLGLATSYSIIHHHDGYLEVDSEVGIGTTFFIYLPALKEVTNLPEVRNELAVTNQGLKILFMEDEETILKSVGEMLEHYGHQVALTTEGSIAIENYRKALEDGIPFDVVIMDLTIPGGIGGQEAIAILREIDPHIKAIVSSGYANDPIISEYERYGFCGVVTKPYKIDELNDVLYRVVEW